MNAYASPYNLPPRAASAIRSPRDVEYSTFSRVTAALRQARSPQEVTAAVHLNTSLWNTLLADLMSPDNRLPQGLRADLAGLAVFSAQHGLKVMSNAAGTEPLVDINLAIMRGLRGEVAQ